MLLLLREKKPKDKTVRPWGRTFFLGKKGSPPNPLSKKTDEGGF
jgi:hypothetical protein